MSRVLPILFNMEMVRAILDGRKSCTRRIVKPQQFIGMLLDKCKNGAPEKFLKEKKLMFKPYCDMTDIELINTAYKAPYQPGDILYVRETWHKYIKRVGEGESCHLAEFYGYKASIANSEDADEPWKPSIHMPKEAARIWLKVTDVRVERLQDITPKGAESEGVGNLFYDDIGYGEKNYGTEVDPEYGIAKEQFAWLWESTIKKSDLDRYGWDANPYVWVIEFERCEKPEGV
ncbi:MAG: hypothetical protein ACLRTZ_02910 [Agathobacter sp.]|jgi:hypothetical protein